MLICGSEEDYAREEDSNAEYKHPHWNFSFNEQ